MNPNLRAVLVGVVVFIASSWAWDKWGRAWLLGAGTGSAGSGTGGAGGSGSGTGGAGGSGGSGGSGGADYAALAAAIQALANGVKLPNIQTAVKTCASGNNELVAGQGGKRLCVLAYAISGAGTITGKWRSGNSTTNLWEIDLNAITGNSGANLATSWPAYLFATASADSLVVNVDAACAVSVTYWQETD